jgi:glucose-1-phosphate cytidylyltransferase
MDIYASQGYSDFVIATGYKSEVIEEWAESFETDWSIKTINTGLKTQTGGRIKKCIEQFDDEVFFATYGDGLGNVNLKRLAEFHKSNKATVTAKAVRPPARFGYLETRDGLVTKFGEKNQVNEGWINGGLFLMNRSIVEYIDGDDEAFETGALPRLTAMKEFYAYPYRRFWFPMDTRSEQQALAVNARQNPRPWKVI